jgi:PAS domain S-box-containing protein
MCCPADYPGCIRSIFAGLQVRESGGPGIAPIKKRPGGSSVNITDKVKVLLVDDEPGLTGIAKLFLERSGEYQIDIANSATIALEMLKASHYDAVVSDYLMPDMDGITFLKTVRSEDTTIPFIVFTGRGREGVVIEALNNGADFYLQKGGDPTTQFTQLQSMIRNGVEQRKAEHELYEKNRILDAILTASPQGIALVKDDRIKWVNEAFADMLKCSKKELIEKKLESLFEDHEVYRRVNEQITTDLGNKFYSELRTRFRQKSGPLIDCDLNIVPLEERSMESGILITITNITKSLAMAREIERLSAFPYLEPNPVIELNQNGQISYFNEAAIDDLIRFEPGATLGVFIPPDLPKLIRALDQDEASEHKRTIHIGNISYNEHIMVSPRFRVIRISAVNTAQQRKIQVAIKEMEDVLRER